MSRVTVPLQADLARSLHDMPLEHRAVLAALIDVIERVTRLRIKIDVQLEVRGLLVIEHTRD